MRVYQNIEDMAVVYRFVLSSDDDGWASILVTNQLIESMGVTPEQLHADAMENAPVIKPVEIKGMSKVMAEMLGIEQAEMMGIFPVAPEGEKFVECQAEKEAEHTEEKASVLGNLKAKREEVTKAPKKENIEKSSRAKGGEAL